MDTDAITTHRRSMHACLCTRRACVNLSMRQCPCFNTHRYKDKAKYVAAINKVGGNDQPMYDQNPFKHATYGFVLEIRGSRAELRFELHLRCDGYKVCHEDRVWPWRGTLGQVRLSVDAVRCRRRVTVSAYSVSHNLSSSWHGLCLCSDRCGMDMLKR